MSNLTDQLANFSLPVFIEKHGITNELGQKLDFYNHRFMWDVYNDMSPKQVCLKAAQIGFSTMAILKSLWLCGAKGMEVIYTLPTSGNIKDFVSSKVNRMITGNPILGSWTKDKDTIEQKQVNGHIISYRGSFVENAALMISADLLISDETSRSDQKILEQYASRLQHSRYKWEWYFSNPSVPGEILDLNWKQSNQKKWHIECNCQSGTQVTKPGWRVLDEDCVNYKDEVFQCPGCHKIISDDDRRMGEWIPTQSITKEGEVPEFTGWWIPVWLYPKIDVKYIKKQKKKDPAYFANFVAGLPHDTPGSRVDAHTIQKIVTDDINPQDGRVIIGCDTGASLVKYVIGNNKGIWHYANDRNYVNLRRIMTYDYPDSILMIDQGGDLIGNRQLQEDFPGRVFLCYFGNTNNSMNLARWGENDEKGKVVIDRNRTIQLVVDELNDKRIPLQGTFDDWYDYAMEWERLYRTKDENSQHVVVYDWVKSSTPCDHPFSTTYWRTGIDKFYDGQLGTIISPKKLKEEPLSTGTSINIQAILDKLRDGNSDWRSEGV
jgi:Phage terminase large subunit (GpA)